ncbi:MAG: KH domain-containing protein [Bdellovibrionales bacterium]|nr:KH domain-containing protein [Bdellovibrionales bacterium]
MFNIFKNLTKKKETSHVRHGQNDEWIEIKASDKKEAIERACNALNIQRSHVEIEDLGGGRIRARKKSAKANTQTEENEGREKKPRRKNYKKKPAQKKRVQERKEASNKSSDEDEYYGENERTVSRKNPFDYDESELVGDQFEEEVEEETEQGKVAKEYLEKIVAQIKEGTTVELFETNRQIRLEIESDESGLFIGKHGSTLEAIQHLLSKMCRAGEDENKRIVIDAEDYRVRREEALEAKAQKLAKKARKERRPVSAEPMNAMDRRVLHMALKGEPGVETKSVGEGSGRRVLIVPKNARPNSSRNGGRRNSRSEDRGNRRERFESYEMPSHDDNFGNNDYE